MASGGGEGHDFVEPLCRKARASKSWMSVGGMKLPVRLNCLIACEKCLRAAISISVTLGGGSVTSVWDNHATESVTRGGEDVAVTKT